MTATTENLQLLVESVLASTRIIDIHTHLFAPSLDGMGLWGIDELVTYHYLESELFRMSSVRPEQYWALSKPDRADLIWRTLFVEATPVSEATRGVIAVLQSFGLPTDASDLSQARAFFRSRNIEAHVARVLDLAGVSAVVMTNDPLDSVEAPLWLRGVPNDPRFLPALRLDRLLNGYSEHWRLLEAQGYAVNSAASGHSTAEVRRFLAESIGRVRPVYMAVSLPDTFQYPEDSTRARLLKEAVLPACREFDLPLSLMIGVRYQVNPSLRQAGDALGRADLRALEALCRQFPDDRFLVSALSRENQHELCVYARKFGNLMPFGCWWFLNQPSIVEEITRERLEMLGTSFIPQHSDARILEQLIYKWRNTRRTLTGVLAGTYRSLVEDGFPVTRAGIERDVAKLFRGNFETWTGARKVTMKDARAVSVLALSRKEGVITKHAASYWANAAWRQTRMIALVAFSAVALVPVLADIQWVHLSSSTGDLPVPGTSKQQTGVTVGPL